MEKTNGKLDPKQRETLANMLRDAREEEQRKIRAAEGTSANSILRSLAEEAGVLTAVDKLKELGSETKKAEKQLADLGFELSGSGDLELTWDASGLLRKKYADRMAKAKVEKSLKKYDLAILSVWTAESGAEAKKIVEDLI